MTIDEISKTLPNGFHDARLIGLQIDFERESAWIELGIDFSHSDIETDAVLRRARLILSGLCYFVVEPPGVDYAYDQQFISSDSSDFGELAAVPDLPRLPGGSFAHWFYSSSNSFIYVAAANAELDWTE
jgi:hypothetical protein